MSGGRYCAAQQSQPVAIRYHFGDDNQGKLDWSDPNLDDSTWPVASKDQWPLPAFTSDGFLWVRFRINVPGDISGPLAIRQLDVLPWPSVEALYVNGSLVGQDGRFPPGAIEWLSRRTAVFDLPDSEAFSAAALRGTSAVIAIRAWYQPLRRDPGATGAAALTIGQAKVLHAEERADRAVARLARTPLLALDLLLTLVGAGILFLWRRSRIPELLWCGVLLCMYALPNVISTLPYIVFLPFRASGFRIALALLQAAQMWITVEFISTVFNFRSRLWKWSAIAALLIFNGGVLMLSSAPDHPSHFLQACLLVLWLAVIAFNLLTLGADLWALIVRRSSRAVAATIAILPLASGIGLFGISRKITAGPWSIDIFDLGYLLSGFAVAAMLSKRALKAMRAGDELSAEFEAAREVQLRLVSPAVDIPGFKIESAYIPAKQVGGDFFRVIPEPDGGVLIVVGDVSGKGLRAAMSVSFIIGALRIMSLVSPAAILSALNNGLTGNLGGGFVTCCIARIDHQGQVTIANAGHLSPYRNAEEVPVEPGLPLGIVPNCVYQDTRFRLAQQDRITFLTDGVVEARDPAGELFGFDRTAAISTQSAENIAHAAQTFGQDDDITVLTVTRIALGQQATAQLSMPTVAPA